MNNVADARREGELFELEMLGGAYERRYRRARPEIEAMPWGTLDPTAYPEPLVTAARSAWTGAAFQEHRTGAACAATLRALIEARAPLDLIAHASRFPLDEVAHVELCSRLAMELGGASELIHDPNALIMDAEPDDDPIMRAADWVVRVFCVGEALSIPMLRGTWRAASHPLPRAVLGRIVKDEAAHGIFGWTFLDWALPHVDAKDRKKLGRLADLSIDEVARSWHDIRRRPQGPPAAVHALGWMQTGAYLSLARASLERYVREPLLSRGIPLAARDDQGDRA